MTVRELKAVSNWGIRYTYKDRMTNTVVDPDFMTRKEKNEFLDRSIYMLFPASCGTETVVAVYLY